MATTTRFVGTCPVCGRRQKVRGGNLVHHGYQRPGHGQIEGDCFAVNRLPHETSPETAKAFLNQVVEPQLVQLEKNKAHIEAAPTLTYKYERRVDLWTRVPVALGLNTQIA